MSDHDISDKKQNGKQHTKNKFTLEEDELIIKLVKEMGLYSWSKIAKNLVNRSGRQCKERYFNYLKPDINRSAWTKQEEALLNLKLSEVGPRWKLISTFFNSRTEVDVKNHYRLMKRRERKHAPIFSSPNTSSNISPAPSAIPDTSNFVADDNYFSCFNDCEDAELFDFFDNQGKEADINDQIF